jgi:membrane associated rhomboid family serine protease
MFFPIGDTQVKGGHKPIVSYGLIAINIGIFIWSISLGMQGFQQFLTEYGSIPGEITRGDDMFTLLTSMFLHGGWMHLIGNMIFLWVFADNIEAIIGSVLFLIFYIAGGLVGTAAHIFTDINSLIPSVGASGAISAILGAYLVMFPKSKIKVFILFFVTYMPALLFLLLWFGQQMFAGMGSLGAVSAESEGVAWWTHIGGFVFGVFVGFVFKSRVNEHNYDRHPERGYV